MSKIVLQIAGVIWAAGLVILAMWQGHVLHESPWRMTSIGAVSWTTEDLIVTFLTRCIAAAVPWTILWGVAIGIFYLVTRKD